MVNTMQNEGNSDCINISDESPSVPQLSGPSKAQFNGSVASSKLSMPLVDEIEMEDISDEIIVPDTPSPILNNKRQQHLTIGRGIKRTCLGRAFSTVSTSSSNSTSSVAVQDCFHQNQEGICTEVNSRIISRKENDIKPFVTNATKNNIPSKERDGLPFPHKFITKNGVYNSTRNGILKQENSLNGVHVLGKSKIFPRKRSTVVINSDSDDSTDNMTETSYKNALHPVESSYELQSSKETISENKMFQKSKTVAEHPVSGKSSSEKLLENYGLMKTRKFTNNCTSASKAETSNRIKSHICKESNFRSNGLNHDSVNSEPSCSRGLKKQFRMHKWNSKSTYRDHYHEQEPKSSTVSYNNKSLYSVNGSQNYLDKSSEEASNQRHSQASRVQGNATAGATNRIANGKVRRKHSHRGQIARFPVDDSDSEVEFYDAKSDLSDLGDTKRPNKVSRKKKQQRRLRQIMDCLSSDSSSDVSVVSEMPVSLFSNATSSQPARNTDSPDPVEQVRQMEEDERLAHMLQAQFDAELEDNDSNEEMCSDLNSSFLSNLSVDSVSSSSESSSSSSFPAAAAMFPYLVSNSLSPRILRDINGLTIEQSRRSSRIQQRQQSIIGWMPESLRTVLTAWMPNFADDSTYESLLELSDQIGEESRGLKKQQINRLPTRKFSTTNMMDCSPSGSGIQQCQDCTICLCEYQNNDLLRSLPCCHEFHAICIDKWLKSHSTCPICRVEVSLRRSLGRKRKS